MAAMNWATPPKKISSGTVTASSEARVGHQPASMVPIVKMEIPNATNPSGVASPTSARTAGPSVAAAARSAGGPLQGRLTSAMRIDLLDGKYLWTESTAFPFRPLPGRWGSRPWAAPYHGWRPGHRPRPAERRGRMDGHLVASPAPGGELRGGAGIGGGGLAPGPRHLRVER